MSAYGGTYGGRYWNTKSARLFYKQLHDQALRIGLLTCFSEDLCVWCTTSRRPCSRADCKRPIRDHYRLDSHDLEIEQERGNVEKVCLTRQGKIQVILYEDPEIENPMTEDLMREISS